MIGGISGAIGWVCPGLAQTMTLDGTLGPARTLTGPVYLIQQRDGRAIGRHLFHSFGRFNLDAGEVARFHHAANIQNIFARVTGGSASTINGLIATNGGQANLFLLNPSGILFGPNARLQVGGSFVATTANHIRFPDGSEFSAVQPQAPPLLRVNLTPGLQYGPRQGNIAHAGNLAVNPGQSLTLLGNTVTSTGRLIAPRGRVELLGDRVILRDQAQIDVSAVGGGGTVLIGGDFQGKGTVPNAQSTFVGPNVTINANGISPPTPLPHHPLTPSPQSHGGRVIVWADDTTRFYGQVNARGGQQAGNGGFVEISGKNHLAFAGQVDVSAAAGTLGTVLFDPRDIIIVAGIGADDAQLADGTIAASDGGTGDFQIGAGAIVGNTILQASRNITFGAPINITTAGAGLTAQAGNNITVNSSIQTNGGAIRLRANDSTTGSASGTGGLFVNAELRSTGGAIDLRGASLTITDSAQTSITGAQISTNSGVGNSGNLNIDVTGAVTIARNRGGLILSDIVIWTGIGANETGSAGDISIRAGSLSMRNNIADAITSEVFGSGNSGAISVDVDGAISLINSSIRSAIATTGSGNVGNIGIQTRTIYLVGNSQIGAVNQGANNNLMAGQGRGGTIRLNASESITLAETGTLDVPGLFTPSPPGSNGQAGTILVNTRLIRISDFAIINAGTITTSNAGTITVNARDVEVSNGGSIFSGTFGDGRGGNLAVQTERLTLQNQGILSSGSVGSGDAGDLTIRASESIQVLNGSRITTDSVAGGSVVNTQLGGNAGNLTIATGSLTTRNGDISSSTNGIGQGGSLRINATGDVNLSGIGGLFATATSTGQGGDIIVEAERMRLQEGAAIAAIGNLPPATQQSSTLGGTIPKGAAGNITLTLRDSLLVDTGAIVTGSFRSGSGNITITAKDVRLRKGSLVSASVFDSTGGGGDISIRSRSFVALEDSDILANAEFGPGGNITINSPVFLAALFNSGQATAVGRNPGSFGQFRGNGRVDISADSRFGTSGTVTYPNLDLTRGLIALPVDLTDPTTQLDTRCQPGTRQATSSYIETGRGGLPQNPEDPLIDDTVTVRWAEVPETSRTQKSEKDNQPQETVEPIVEGQILQRDAQGALWLVAQTNQPVWFVPPECQPYQP